MNAEHGVVCVCARWWGHMSDFTAFCLGVFGYLGYHWLTRQCTHNQCHVRDFCAQVRQETTRWGGLWQQWNNTELFVKGRGRVCGTCHRVLSVVAEACSSTALIDAHDEENVAVAATINKTFVMQPHRLSLNADAWMVATQIRIEF